MQQQYRVIIKNERYAQIKIFQIVLLAVMAIIFCVAGYFENNMFNFTWPCFICFSLFFAINQEDFKRNKFLRTTNFLSLGFLFAVGGSFFMLEWWMIALVVIIAILQLFIKSQYEIEINEKSVFLKTFPQKHVAWQSLQNVIIKDELFTIDYNNNKIFQAEIVPLLSKIGSEKEFNDFCRLQLQLHKQ
jgi:hypothetical protein